MLNQNEKEVDPRKNEEIKIGDKVYYLNENNEETEGIINNIGYIIDKKIYFKEQLSKEKETLKKNILIKQINNLEIYLDELKKRLEKLNDKEN